MRSAPWLLVMLCSSMLVACGTNSEKAKPECSDGIDNDGDGLIDYPADPGCTSPDDNSEDSLPLPQCSDGIDNDGDGKIDYPDDPGCVAPESDSEVDDCPDGPMCPECSNGKDDDGNGLIDYPADPGCSSASDNLELTIAPNVCGQNVPILSLPFSNEAVGMFTSGQTSVLTGSCGGDGPEAVYSLYLTQPKVVVVTTQTDQNTVDTVVYIRGKDCSMSSELACNDDIVAMTDTASTVTTSLMPGLYFVVVDSSTANGNDVGTYDVQVNLYDGEGVACTTQDTCGPGLVCRTPLGGTAMVCSKPECSDGVDDDGDGKKDYPDDPGCTSPSDNDETDDCPSGPMCPQCGNGKDDDGDGKIDYPADPSCKSASGTSEACNTTEGVTELTMPATQGDNTNATDDSVLTCAFGTGGKDLTYQLIVPKLTSLNINVTTTSFSEFDWALYGAACGPTELSCQNFAPITEGALAAGDYYLTVDGDDNTQVGPFEIDVSGVIADGQSCESPLAQSGALVCAPGYACKGTVGSRTCAKAECNDGIDNNGDGKIDYPNDPGCSSPSDDTETTVCPGVNCPVCSNGTDDDADGKIDYPADFGCSSAGGTSEVFCALETDPVTAIAAAATTANLATMHADLTLDCGFASDNDKTWVLELPVPVQTLTVSTTGSTNDDTVLELWDTQCDAPGIACNDDINPGVNDLSSITLTGLSAGNYAVTVKAYDTTTSGAIKLNVSGVVAKGTACSSALFTASVLKCATGTTCTGTPKKCN